MATLYVGRLGKAVDYTSLAPHHSAYLKTTLKRVFTCIDDITGRDNSPLVCADFGTGDGGLAVNIFEAVRDHLTSKQDDRELTFVLEDQETNDFNKTLQRFKSSSLWNDDKVSIMCNGKNMYGRCFSTASLHVALTSIATHIFKKPPVQLNGVLFPLYANMADKEKKIFRNKLTGQWCEFLNARSAELKTGGYLINYAMTTSDDSKYYGPWPGGCEMLNEVWRGFCAENKIDSLNRVTYPLLFGLADDYLAPFKDNVYKGLKFVSTETVEPDFYKYPKMTGDDVKDAERMEQFAADTTLYLKAWSYNGIKCSLPDKMSDEEKHEILDEFFDRVQNRVRKGDLEEGYFHITEVVLKRV